MIDAYLIDSRGVYLSAVAVDPLGPQPAGAVYVAPPAAQSGRTRVWSGSAWTQVVDTDVPPLPGPAPEPVPAQCTRRQGLLALLANDIKPAQVQTLIDAIEDDNERIAAQIEFEANEWDRDNPVVQQMWATLGGTPEALDDLYRLAVTL